MVCYALFYHTTSESSSAACRPSWPFVCSGAYRVHVVSECTNTTNGATASAALFPFSTPTPTSTRYSQCSARTPLSLRPVRRDVAELLSLLFSALLSALPSCLPLQHSAVERASEPTATNRNTYFYDARGPRGRLVSCPSAPTPRRPASPPPATAAAPMGLGWDGSSSSRWRGYLPAAQNELLGRGRNCWPFGQVSKDRRWGRITADASYCI